MKIRRSITVDEVLWKRFTKVVNELKQLGLIGSREGKSTIIERWINDYTEGYTKNKEKES